MRRVVVLVCGEPMRGDDGVAQAVLDALSPETRSLADVREVGQLMPDDLCDLGGAPVVLLDAVDGIAPGKLVDLPLTGLSDACGRGLSPASSHALPIPLTLGVVERLAGKLPEGRFLGIGAASYAIGAPLSPPVQEAVTVCCAQLGEWIRVLGGESGRADTCA
jgi:hydrogenase maturation protease